MEYQPDQQHVSRDLKALGLTDAEGVATLGTDDVAWPKASQRTAKWHHPPEEVREEDDLLTGEELKLFQSVPARLNFLAMDRPDLLYSVTELTRKMASPRTQGLTALKRVARYTINYRERPADIHGPNRTTILRCFVMQTLLDATPRENPQWEVLRCGMANS